MPTFRYSVDLKWTGATGSPGVNVWHGRTAGTSFGGSDVPTLVGYVEDFYTALAVMYPTQLTISGGEAASGLGAAEGESVAAPAWSVTGTGSSSFLPPANAMLVDWRTSTGGRRGRGRTFLGPLVEGALEGNGTPLEDFRTLVQDAADDLIDASDSFANGAWGIYSRADSVLRDLVSASVPNMFAVLRSRRD